MLLSTFIWRDIVGDIERYSFGRDREPTFPGLFIATNQIVVVASIEPDDIVCCIAPVSNLHKRNKELQGIEQSKVATRKNHVSIDVENKFRYFASLKNRSGFKAS
jgi:hypothetical protein